MNATYLFDCDGVLYLHDSAIAGAAEVLQRLHRDGVPMLFCTNNSSQTPRHLVGKLQRLLGYSAAEAQVITSAQAAANEVRAAGIGSASVLGMEGIVTALHEAGIATDDADAGALVVGIDFDLDYDRIRLAADVVRRGGLFVATNTDATYPVPGGMWPGAGTVVAAVAAASGRGPDLIAGKPHLPMVDLIRDRSGTDEIIVVGDRPETDLALAKAGGWGSVAVLTGVTTSPDEIPSEFAPDRIIASVADLLAS